MKFRDDLRTYKNFFHFKIIFFEWIELSKTNLQLSIAHEKIFQHEKKIVEKFQSQLPLWTFFLAWARLPVQKCVSSLRILFVTRFLLFIQFLLGGVDNNLILTQWRAFAYPFLCLRDHKKSEKKKAPEIGSSDRHDMFAFRITPRFQKPIIMSLPRLVLPSEHCFPPVMACHFQVLWP